MMRMDQDRRAARMIAAALLSAGLAAGAVSGALLGAAPAAAQSGQAAGTVEEDALAGLFAQLRDGQADPHLPYVLARLKRALADQDLLGVLALIEPEHFNTQFGLLQSGGQPPAQTLGQFACEFFTICDISKTYGFNDIVSAQVLRVSPEGGLTNGPVEVTLELRMWDGLTLISVVFYDPASARLTGPVG